jgi:Protoglobin
MSREGLAGYSYGTTAVASSPISLEDFALLKQSVGFGDADEEALRRAGAVLVDQIEAILDVWLAPVVATPFLATYYSRSDGQLDQEYFNVVRQRFGQWIRDTCLRPYDQEWLNYQHEIGLRHHRSKKNQTDQAQTTPHIPLRYMVASIYPITVTIKPFLAKKGRSSEEVERMYQAWGKAVCLQVALWSYPYAKEGDF